MKPLPRTLFLFLAFLVAACTSSQLATYRPADSTEPTWQINVYHKSGVTDNFKVVINDSTVIDESANFVKGNLEETGRFRDKEVRLLVTYADGVLGVGRKFTATVFISNELATKLEFH